MHALRLRLPRFAALVLLVWLFASGMAFAHTCQTKIDLDCDGCCVEMKAPAVSSTGRLDTVAATIAPVPVPQAQAVHLTWVPLADAVVPATQPRPGGSPPEITIVFLRLAL